MTDLPREGEVVLCGFHDRGHPDLVVVSVYRGGRWCHRKGDAAHGPPDWWVPLPLARRARKTEAALRAIEARLRDVIGSGEYDKVQVAESIASARAALNPEEPDGR